MRRMTARGEMALAILLAVLSCTVLGIGAPPSDFAPMDSIWWTLEPLMWPALFGGVVLAFIALLASGVAMRLGAVLCLTACASTGLGVIVAAGISAQYSLRAALFNGAFLAIPSLTLLDALRRLKSSVGGNSAIGMKEGVG